MNKPVWIYESRTIDKSPEGDYVYHGLAADFKKNENGRTYSREDYLSHLGYLNEKINSGSLWGEIDHPERYNVLVKEASHIIKELKYNEEKDIVEIKIELFDNANGAHVKGIVDKGAPLYISSRASGFIDDKGNVVLERIYTYDIVYEPGFKNAKLKRLNESLGIKEDSGITIYEMKEINTEEKTTSMSKPGVQQSNEINQLIETLNSYTEKTNQAFASLKDQLAEIKNRSVGDPSLDLSKEMETIKENFNKAMDEWETHSAEFGGHKTKLKIMEDKIAMMDAKLDAISNWSLNCEKQVNEHKELNSKLVDHINVVATLMNENIIEIYEFKDKIAAHVNEVSQIMNENIQEIDETIDSVKEHHNIHATSTNDIITKLKGTIIPHIDLITESVNNIGDKIGHADKNLKNIRTHINNMAILMNENAFEKAVVDLSDISEKDGVINANIKVDEAVAGKMEITKQDHKITIGEEWMILEEKILSSPKLISRMGEVYEEKFGIPIVLANQLKAGEHKNIGSSVERMIAEAKTKNAKSLSSANESTYPFLKVISDEFKGMFANLSETKKARVADVIVKKSLLKSGEIENAIGMISEQNDGMVEFESYLSGDQVKRWESINEEKRELAFSMFSVRNIRDKFEFDSFFDDLTFVQDINEGIDHQIVSNSDDPEEVYIRRVLGS